MASESKSRRFVFPGWVNYLLPLIVLGAVGGGLFVPVLVGFGLSADTLWRGYSPSQPVPFSHALHAGELGMDCRYCHTTVEDHSFAAVPDTHTCISCHSPDEGVAGVFKESDDLAAVHRSHETGEAVPWRKVHQMPDFVYFDHSAHVTAGVSCIECHGRVDRMEVVYKAESMSMAWCLDCHTEPEKHLRPVEEVTNFDWDPRQHLQAHAEAFEVDEDDRERLAAGDMSRDEAQLLVGNQLVEDYSIHDQPFMMSCSTCHR